MDDNEQRPLTQATLEQEMATDGVDQAPVGSPSQKVEPKVPGESQSRSVLQDRKKQPGTNQVDCAKADR